MTDLQIEYNTPGEIRRRRPMTQATKRKLARRIRRFWKLHPERRAQHAEFMRQKIKEWWAQKKGITANFEKPMRQDTYKQTITICRYCKRPF